MSCGHNNKSAVNQLEGGIYSMCAVTHCACLGICDFVCILYIRCVHSTQCNAHTFVEYTQAWPLECFCDIWCLYSGYLQNVQSIRLVQPTWKHVNWFEVAFIRYVICATICNHPSRFGQTNWEWRSKCQVSRVFRSASWFLDSISELWDWTIRNEKLVLSISIHLED